MLLAIAVAAGSVSSSAHVEIRHPDIGLDDWPRQIGIPQLGDLSLHTHSTLLLVCEKSSVWKLL